MVCNNNNDKDKDGTVNNNETDCKFWRRSLSLAKICCHHHVFIYALIFVQIHLSILCITSCFTFYITFVYCRRAKSVLSLSLGRHGG